MPDIVDAGVRSRMMSAIRGTNTKPELLVRRYLHARGFRYRLHVKDLPGKPDIVLPRYRAAVFVHGCFWHRHPGCRLAYHPKSREEFWEPKLRGNAERDARQHTELEQAGWHVLIAWECETSVDRLATLALAITQERRYPQAGFARNEQAAERQRIPSRTGRRP